jgi:hypothetical protein
MAILQYEEPETDVQAIWSNTEADIQMPSYSHVPQLNEDIWDRITAYRQKYPKKFAHFDRQIMCHYIRNIQNDVTFAWKMNVRKVLLATIQGYFKEAQLFVVGSTINGCGSLNADMDCESLAFNLIFTYFSVCCSIGRYNKDKSDRSFVSNFKIANSSLPFQVRIACFTQNPHSSNQ